MNHFARKLARFQTVLQDAGGKAVCQRICNRILRMSGFEYGAHANWLRQQRKLDNEFDSLHGTQTSVNEIFDLTVIGENARHATPHIATVPDEFDRAIRAINIDLGKGYTFIDLGCGKGRALLLAAKLQFDRIVGVEFAAELVETAKQNIRIMNKTRPQAYIEVVFADAAQYQLPLTPLVIYLFNPFGAKVIREVARNALESWRKSPRPIILLYMNPVHLADLEQGGWSVTASCPPCLVLTPKSLSLDI